MSAAFPASRMYQRLSGYSPKAMAIPDFTLDDQARDPWRLADHLDAGVLLVFLRGDW